MMADVTTHFRLPNARAGQDYCGVIKLPGAESNAASVVVRQLSVPPQLGLCFDPARQALVGTPLQAGEYELALEWSRDGSNWQAGKCPLIVIADPRSLWKVLEPPPDAPWQTPHSASDCIRLPTNVAASSAASTGPQAWALLAASRRGRSHEHAGSFRDDDFFLTHVDGWSVLAVADGAGSAKSSRQGARLAVQQAGAYLAAHLQQECAAQTDPLLAQWDTDQEACRASLGQLFQSLFYTAATHALDAIEAEAAANQQIARDFATTLLLACVRQHGAQTLVATFWIGDGAIAAYGPRGQVQLMGMPDGGEYAGQTRFLDRACLAAPTAPPLSSRIGIKCFRDLCALILMTDGVSDPRFETDKGLQTASKWDALWDELAPLLAGSEPQQRLLDWLHFFTPGHHDDRTLAMLCQLAPEGT
jgi:serine/threonine protein phosphatase PrpC